MASLFNRFTTYPLAKQSALTVSLLGHVAMTLSFMYRDRRRHTRYSEWTRGLVMDYVF